MKVISLAKTKELLGITDTASDTAISAKIPYIDSKVKQICNNRFNMMVVGDVTLDSPYVPIISIHNSNGSTASYDDIGEYLEVGQLISGTGILSDAYIEEIYYNGDLYDDGSTEFVVPTIKLSANATATTGATRIYLGINICYQDTIAKGIKYLITGTSETLPSNTVISKSFGVVSKTFSQSDSNIDNKFGLPAWFIKALPKYASGH